MYSKPINDTCFNIKSSPKSFVIISAGFLAPSTFSRPSSDVSQFIFLNPFWLMLACKSILRHDLSNAIKKIVIEPPKRRGFFRDHDCPVISKDEVVELWTVNAKKGDLGVDQRNFFKATKACLGKLEELDRKLKEVDSDLRFEGEAGDITPAAAR